MGVEVENAVAKKYVPWIRRKVKGKPSPVINMMYRANGTGMAVVSLLKDVPFTELSANLYFMAQDMKTKEFTRLYESQLELASIDPDKYIHKLYQFFNDVGRHIKKENLYREFFEFASLCNRMRYKFLSKPGSEHIESVVNAYQSMLLETYEFLRPNKFDFSKIVVGMDTKGNLLLADDAYPYIDEPIRDMEDYLETQTTRPVQTMDELIEMFFKKHGYRDIKGQDDLNNMMEQDRIYTHQHTTLAPFINEYTYDILPSPDKLFNRDLLSFLTYMPVKVDVEELKDRLMKRARTLPANGMVVEIGPASVVSPYRGITKILMREVLYGDDIVMLYKMEVNHGEDGEISGCYNTREKAFYSILQEAGLPEPYGWTQSFILYLYGCAVLRDGEKMLSELDGAFCFGIPSVEANGLDTRKTLPMHAKATLFARGGRLKRSDNVEDGATHQPTGARKGNDAYESEERAIQGFVRKVGAGRTPSPEAVARATALGFELAQDETYVQPFIKNVLKLKEKTEK